MIEIKFIKAKLKMFLVGLTGGIACGKSSVAEVFVKNNIPFINADHITRQSESSIHYFDSVFTSIQLTIMLRYIGWHR